eukprot:3120678-Pleurochrysis_carterae.AAC.2
MRQPHGSASSYRIESVIWSMLFHQHREGSLAARVRACVAIDSMACVAIDSIRFDFAHVLRTPLGAREVQSARSEDITFDNVPSKAGVPAETM